MSEKQAKAARRAGLARQVPRVRVTHSEVDAIVANTITVYHERVLLPTIQQLITTAAARTPWYSKLFYKLQAKRAMVRLEKNRAEFAAMTAQAATA
jgi:hypothetical protein